MKKSILNLGKQLNKTEQKTINGGFVCPASPICYGDFNTGFLNTCGTCEEFDSLPNECKNRVLVSVTCFSI